MTVYGGPPGRSGRPPRRATPRRPRWVPWASAGGGVVAVAVIITLIFTLSRPASSTDDAAFVPGPSATPTASPSPSAAPSSSPTPAPSTGTPKTSSTHKALPTAAPTVAPPTDEPKPPPAGPPTDTSSDCTPTFSGTDASRGDVSAALTQAAATDWWVGVTPPKTLDGTAYITLPTITLPDDLIKAVAWQESGWQSSIIDCHGAIGLMQLTPGDGQAIDHVYSRFGLDNLDPTTLQGNADIGAAYLEWLLVYYGSYYFGENYDKISDFKANVPLGAGCDPDPASPACVQMSLADVVLSAYNAGSPEDADGKHLTIRNWGYVNAVECWWTVEPWRTGATSCPSS